ncbi:MAG: trehalose synthase [Ilumatobacteraceae bacterium]|nr:trehalose synthase [Ilumatobacteraceae bacterium]
MPERWFRQAVIYCLDVDTYQDSNGDGIGDLPGLIDRLDHLARLGVTCIWLNPIHPSPDRDDGYDITDFYAVSPSLGSLGDFVELIHQAKNRGLRVIIDLVVNHTSDEHPWFQAARSDPKSPFRDWYVWSKEQPATMYQGMVFPGYQKTTWTFDEQADAWYYHRFYDFQPDLNMSNPAVRQEIEKIIGFWLQLGVDGFRLDAAPFVIELTVADDPNPRQDFDWLTDFRTQLSWRRGDAVILAEANVDADHLSEYFGDGNRLPMLFNFILNQRTFLALARAEVGPILQALAETPAIPDTCQWATFLRNHDEVDLGRLQGHEHDEVFAAFGPEPNMQLYGRGIRRRLAPMLDNDQQRLKMAYALQFSLPGSPVIRYGDEIGMGEDLRLPERNAIRTPMQWSQQPHAGFSTCRKKSQLRRPIISGGDFGFETVNVEDQQRDPNSLLTWFQRALLILRECPEFSDGSCSYIDSGHRSVLSLLHEAPSGAMLAITNLSDESCRIDLGRHEAQDGPPVEVFSDQTYEPIAADLDGIDIGPYGYRWVRLRRTIGGRAGSAPHVR